MRIPRLVKSIRPPSSPFLRTIFRRGPLFGKSSRLTDAPCPIFDEVTKRRAWRQTRYVDGYLRCIRGLSPVSLANHITSAIDVLKYCLSESGEASSANAMIMDPKICRLMRARNMQQTMAERQRKDAKDSEPRGMIIWEQVRRHVTIYSIETAY